MLQTPQLSPYLLVSPHPSRFSSLLNLGHHFYFWNRNKVKLGPTWNKDNLFTFSQSGKCNLKEFTWFVSALILLMWSLCLPNANWHLCVVHRAATDSTTTYLLHFYWGILMMFGLSARHSPRGRPSNWPSMTPTPPQKGEDKGQQFMDWLIGWNQLHIQTSAFLLK